MCSRLITADSKFCLSAADKGTQAEASHDHLRLTLPHTYLIANQSTESSESIRKCLSLQHPTYVHTYIGQAQDHTRIHTIICMCVCIHMYVHTYVHTYECSQCHFTFNHFNLNMRRPAKLHDPTPTLRGPIIYICTVDTS